MTLMIESIETFVCLQCNGAVPRECVAPKFDEKTGIRTTKVFCEHCDALFKAKQRFTGSGWMLDGEVERVTDANAIAGMKARIDHVRGNRIVKKV